MTRDALAGEVDVVGPPRRVDDLPLEAVLALEVRELRVRERPDRVDDDVGFDGLDAVGRVDLETHTSRASSNVALT